MMTGSERVLEKNVKQEEESTDFTDDTIQPASEAKTEGNSPQPEKECGTQTTTTGLSKYENSWIRRALTPKRCRWDPDTPHVLTVWLCILYGAAGSLTVANLYYNQPILNKITATFDVSYETSSQVATLLQSGYATGMVFILPLGDILERRLLVIGLVFFTATMWVGLCVTNNFTVFRALSYICGCTTVTPQLMIPLVGDYAPAHRKATTLSIVSSGILIGLLIARLLSGIITNFTEWRNIYWFACGAQYLLASMLYLFFPDYPSTNPGGLNYFKALGTIVHMIFTEPVLVQAALIAFAFSGTFTSFWTTLTFLLASPPYEFTSLEIGLLSLLVLVTIILIPITGPHVDRFQPLVTVLGCASITLVGVLIGAFSGNYTVAGPVIQGISIDFGFQISQVANRISIFAINPKARNRVNTAYMVFAFAGQLSGTAIGNRLYAKGGWQMGGYCGIALIVMAILVVLSRGPHETRWVGWKGGWTIRRIVKKETTEASPKQNA